MNWKSFVFPVFTLLSSFVFAQPAIDYEISFENAVHHEAQVKVHFNELPNRPLLLSMSRSSPGRYALHEFAKNVYGLVAEDGQGRSLPLERLSPHQWRVSGHDGSVNLQYTLFANQGDGTYSQIDETHAHLNIPATFLYAPDYPDHPIRITFHPREDLRWKVATQLKALEGNTYYAPGLHYFMDSPTEISDHQVKSFEVASDGRTQAIRFVLHQSDGYAGFDAYMEQVRKIVAEEIKVFGELPEFDHGSYTFLACYLPQASGDGMEHRNSTVCTNTRSLENGGLRGNIGTIAHEFFHAWNVERMRPASLEPFDYQEANMSGELWFAEGFTSYYTDLILCRTGIISTEEYLHGLESTLDYVVNSPGREYYGPAGMSMQAPFADAATSVDPVNQENTFISYYSYGKVLGLCLDLMLRSRFEDKTLDGFMRKAWETHGNIGSPYTNQDLQEILGHYAGRSFAEDFFNASIYQSDLPDLHSLFASVGVAFGPRDPSRPYLGASFSREDNAWLIGTNPLKGYALYEAGLENGDRILTVGDRTASSFKTLDALLGGLRPGQSVSLRYSRFGQIRETRLTPGPHPGIGIALLKEPGKEAQRRQAKWLGPKEN